MPDSYATYQAKQREFGIMDGNSPAKWWGDWLSEQCRASFINRLPEDHRKYARECGLARTWKMIAPTVQAELMAME